LASIEDICRFADEFRSRYSTLSVLINNAGILASRRQLTKDGYELNFGVNYLGHFLLTNLLLDLIIPAKGRIVTLSSVAHKIGSIHFDDINLTGSYGWLKAYSQSKLANVLFTYELARRIKGTGATANCLHPGVVATNIIVDRQTGLGSLTARLMKHFFISPEQGAETAIYLATSPEVQGVSGQYFRRKQPIESSQLSYDTETAVRLWDLSERMTGLSQEQAVMEWQPANATI
jgi:NAD(P)-dependent dehydrogenase (short-subunit alcohol dehydrogenase family)